MYPRVPCTRTWDGTGSLVAFVLSLNLHRRHLDESQRAMVAAKAKPVFEEEAREREFAGKPAPNSEQGRSAEKAAQLLNVGKTSVYEASKVLRDGAPELVAAVEQGGPVLRLSPRDEARGEFGKAPDGIGCAALREFATAPLAPWLLDQAASDEVSHRSTDSPVRRVERSLNLVSERFFGVPLGEEGDHRTMEAPEARRRLGDGYGSR